MLGVAAGLQIPAASAPRLQRRPPQLLRSPAAASAESVSAAGAELRVSDREQRWGRWRRAVSGEKGGGGRRARPAAWPRAGVSGSPATRGAGDRDRAGGAKPRGPRRVARSSRPRPLLLELPPPSPGSGKRSSASSSRRRRPAGQTWVLWAEAAARLRAGAADAESAVRAG